MRIKTHYIRFLDGLSSVTALRLRVFDIDWVGGAL
jgi:hypothetical protein